MKSRDKNGAPKKNKGMRFIVECAGTMPEHSLNNLRRMVAEYQKGEQTKQAK
jgi:hypothetical protein